MLLKMWFDPGAPPQLAALHIPPIGSQLVHSLSIVYPLKLIRGCCGTRFRGMRSLTFAACGKKNVIFHYFHNLPLSQKLDPRLDMEYKDVENCILDIAKSKLGESYPGERYVEKETWWWTEQIQEATTANK